MLATSVVIIAWVAVVINGVFSVALLIMCVAALMFIKRTGMQEIDRAEKTLPTALTGIVYSELPIACVAVIADHKGIPLEKVAEAYEKDAMERRAIVQAQFMKDAVTTRFLRTNSRFLRYGYIGEALLFSASQLLVPESSAFALSEPPASTF